MKQIILADVSMNLDNALAVGPLLSVVLMGVAANLLERQRWIAWAGLAIVLYVALHMIWEGWGDVAEALHG